MNAPRKRDTRIPRQPLLWLAAALLFTLPPLFSGLVLWAPILLLLSLAAKFWMEPRGYRLRFAALKLALAATALGFIFLNYGAIKGIEPGVSLIVVLMAMKILEAHTAREFHFMVMLGWVLCLCGFFLEQNLGTAFCLFITFTLLLAALVQFHRGSSAGRLWSPLRTAGTLLGQSIPLILLLFLIFPRISAGFRIFTANNAAAAGFSNRLSPGSVASLANSNAIAFRAEFPDGKIPPADALYWRGLVMVQGDGMEWRAPDPPAALPRSTPNPSRGEPVRQWITIEAHGAHWMFALDWPGDAPAGAMRAPGDYLWSYGPITKPRRYEVTSFPEMPRKELQPREQKLMLAAPASISPRVRELAQSWAAADRNPRAIVLRGLEFFRTQGFRYSLAPGQYKSNDLDEFLFHRRVGFCEHYAGTYATLMRLAGVPARVVVGYLGGEFNAMGRFFLVRQSDTHAWCEVWFPESGWRRVDPTSVVAPERVNLGLASFLDRNANVGETKHGYAFSRTLARQPLFARIRLTWQTLNYVWDTRVLSFDAETQQALVTEMGLPETKPVSLLMASAILITLAIAIIAGWMQLHARSPRDEVKRLYARFCRKAARLGAERDPCEGPLQFSHRAARLLPAESERIARISHHYLSLRYARGATPSILEQLAREVDLFGSTRVVARERAAETKSR